MIPTTGLRNREFTALVEPGRLHSIMSFARSTTATYYGPAGSLLTSASGAPRYEYNAAGALLGLLLEEQRTNLLTYSGVSSGIAAMTTQNVADATISWLGAFTKAVSFGNNSVARYAYCAYNNTPNTVYTVSVFVSMDDGNPPVFNGSGAGNDAALVINGQIAPAPIVTSLGGGVYRLWSARSHTGVQQNNGVVKFTNNNARTFKVTGFQLEAAPFVSSYIPTTATAVTRGADILTASSLAASRLNAAAGTLVFDGVNSPSNGASNTAIVTLNDGTSNELIQLRRLASGTTIDALVTDGGVDQFDATGVAVANSAAFRAALAWAANDFAFCVNGGTVQTDTSGSLPTVDRLVFGALNGHVRRVRLYGTRRTNADLQGATT